MNCQRSQKTRICICPRFTLGLWIITITNAHTHVRDVRQVILANNNKAESIKIKVCLLVSPVIFFNKNNYLQACDPWYPFDSLNFFGPPLHQLHPSWVWFFRTPWNLQRSCCSSLRASSQRQASSCKSKPVESMNWLQICWINKNNDTSVLTSTNNCNNKNTLKSSRTVRCSCETQWLK